MQVKMIRHSLALLIPLSSGRKKNFKIKIDDLNERFSCRLRNSGTKEKTSTEKLHILNTTSFPGSPILLPPGASAPGGGGGATRETLGTKLVKHLVAG